MELMSIQNNSNLICLMFVIVVDAYGDHSLIYLLPNLWKDNNLVVSELGASA